MSTHPGPLGAGRRTGDLFNRFLAAFWLLAGAGVCVYARQLGLFGPAGPESGFFLMIAGLLMAASGAALLVSSGRTAAPAGRWPRGAGALRVLMVLAGTALLILLMRWLGFLGAALLVMPLLLGMIERRSVGFVLAVGWGSALFAYLLFGTVLGTLLPRGPWGF